MICDRATQIDIRQAVKLYGPLPEVIDFEGERVVTTWTPTAFGGRRQWWLCPSCDRRCAIIYRRGPGPLWGCRVCMGGCYASEHMSRQDRLIQKAAKIRQGLGQKDGGIALPFPAKPNGMHWRTYDRLKDKAQQIEGRIWVAEMTWLERLKGTAK